MLSTSQIQQPIPPIEPFVLPSRTITLTQMDIREHHSPDLAIKEVLDTLATNHIPLAWVDHAYTYGLHYLNHHYNHSPEAGAIYQDLDNECICWLGIHGLPPAIPEWDGWYTLMMEDVGHIHMLQITEEDHDHYCLDDSHNCGGRPPLQPAFCLRCC